MHQYRQNNQRYFHVVRTPNQMQATQAPLIQAASMQAQPMRKTKRIPWKFLILTTSSLVIGHHFLGGTNHHTASAASPHHAPATPAKQETPTPAQAPPAQAAAPQPATVAPLSGKVAFLTFDDGPDANTPAILDALKEAHVKATFFLLGSNVKLHPDLVKRILDEGHSIGLHSMTHDNKTLYKSGSPDNFIGEMLEEQKLIKDMTGKDINLIRAPYGSKPGVTPPFQAQLEQHGFKMWDWTIDSLDWDKPGNPKGVEQEVFSHISTARDREVILFHGKQVTVHALPDIITYLKQQGYEFRSYDPAIHFQMNFWKNPNL